MTTPLAGDPPQSVEPAPARCVETALERERDFNAALLDTLGALVCVIDREGRIIRFNRFCQELSGYTIDEVRRQPFWELLIPPDEVEGVKEVVRYLVEEQRPNHWENHWITRSGARRLIRWSNTVLLDAGGQFSHIIGTGIDVTERRQAEAERDRLLGDERRAREDAEQAERRWAFLAEAGRVLASTLEDYESTLERLARLAVPYLATCCLVRIAREDNVVVTVAVAHVDPQQEAFLASLDPAVYDIPTPDGVPPLVAAGRSVIVNGAASVVEEISTRTLTDPQGERVREDVRRLGLTSHMAVPLAARGRIFGAMLFGSTDEARPYGPEHLVLAEALAARAALAVDNARLYREAQRALQAREDFLVIASHELKTPLTSLHLAVQALLRRARAAGADERSPPRDLLGAVERSSARIGALVDDILDISRVTAAAPVPALQQVDLRAVVEEVVGSSAELLRAAGCATRLEARGPTDGRWDRRWLVRIVSNLLSNAAKYGRGRPVELDVEGDDATVRLTVRDHGIGVPAPEQARIFQRFERAVSVQYYGGFGLGLWIVRRMVEALGGAVRVDSRVGEGAAFTVSLPRRGPQA
jgi:PAS domain S-box-containing protein